MVLLVLHRRTEVVGREDLNWREVCRLDMAFEPCLDVNLRSLEVVVGENLVVVGDIQMVVRDTQMVVQDNPEVHRSVVEGVLEEGSLCPFEISLKLHLRLKCSRLGVHGTLDPEGRFFVPSLLVVMTFVCVSFDSRLLNRPRKLEV